MAFAFGDSAAVCDDADRRRKVPGRLGKRAFVSDAAQFAGRNGDRRSTTPGWRRRIALSTNTLPALICVGSRDCGSDSVPRRHQTAFVEIHE
jgi:hypothetical protein